MRLNKLYRPAIQHEEILAELRPVLEDFSKNRIENERFGDFCIRKEYVKETEQGADFHE
jgi:sulfite reductase (NADPH) hemoprotein beta-component